MAVEAKKYNKIGEEQGKYQLPEKLFGQVPNTHVIYEVVKAYLANQRQGTASTKGRSEVRGGGKKPYRQKGTGRARAGTIRSPLWVGGGTTFGPKPRDYSVRVPKRIRRKALVSAFSIKAREEAAMILEELNIEKPKTKSVAEMLKNIGLNKKKVLFLTGEYDKNLYLSGRNIPTLSIMRSTDVNAYAVMNSDVLLMTEAAVEKLQEVFANE